jgi:hypothetical protein
MPVPPQVAPQQVLSPMLMLEAFRQGLAAIQPIHQAPLHQVPPVQVVPQQVPPTPDMWLGAFRQALDALQHQAPQLQPTQPIYHPATQAQPTQPINYPAPQVQPTRPIYYPAPQVQPAQPIQPAPDIRRTQILRHQGGQIRIQTPTSRIYVLSPVPRAQPPARQGSIFCSPLPPIRCYFFPPSECISI